MTEPTVQSQENNPLTEEEKELRIGLARVYAAITSRAKVDTVASISMEDLIAEQIFFLDSSQVDVASQIAEEQSEAAKLELERTQGMIGYKQRLEQLNDMMTGADGKGGLIASARAFEVPIGETTDEEVDSGTGTGASSDAATNEAASGSPLYPSTDEASEYQGGS